jgi:mRNA-degrading endonuclease RelE of RelBE toxin-antitoxin system
MELARPTRHCNSSDKLHRILYTIEDDRLIVLVVRIGHRSEVYRKI